MHNLSTLTGAALVSFYMGKSKSHGKGWSQDFVLCLPHLTPASYPLMGVTLKVTLRGQGSSQKVGSGDSGHVSPIPPFDPSLSSFRSAYRGQTSVNNVSVILFLLYLITVCKHLPPVFYERNACILLSGVESPATLRRARRSEF